MKDIKFNSMTALIGLCLTIPTHAEISWGDEKSDLGALKVSGYVRGNYQQKDYGYEASDGKIQFDAAQLNLDYDSKKYFAHMEYLCYQYDTLCDFSTMVDGYIGYKMNDKNTLTFGVQPIPFGPSRYWESSLFGGLNNTAGLEDAHNLGLNLHWELPTQTQIDAAYFARDAGSFVGSSQRGARYTANPIADSSGEHTQEKNMWIGRIVQDISALHTESFDVKVGGSYWYSDIENKSSAQTGNRKAWALFTSMAYSDLAFTFTAGKTAMTNHDSQNSESTTFGSYDSEYLIANDAKFYTADLSYKLDPFKNGLTFRPYLMHSSYVKDQSGYKDSVRNIAGLAMDYKKLSLVTEYFWSKNDPFIGGQAESLAQGDSNRWNKLLNLTLFYYF